MHPFHISFRFLISLADSFVVYASMGPIEQAADSNAVVKSGDALSQGYRLSAGFQAEHLTAMLAKVIHDLRGELKRLAVDKLGILAEFESALDLLLEQVEIFMQKLQIKDVGLTLDLDPAHQRLEFDAHAILVWDGREISLHCHFVLGDIAAFVWSCIKQ
jgi:hypothetical protein